MATQQDSSLSELMLAAEYADFNQRIHWPRCRARGRLEDCKRCDALEDEVIRTDVAMRKWFSALSQGRLTA